TALHFSGLCLVARNRGSRTHPFSAFVLGFAIRIRSEGFTSPLSSFVGRIAAGVTRPATLSRAGVQLVDDRPRVVGSYVVCPQTRRGGIRTKAAARIAHESSA